VRDVTGSSAAAEDTSVAHSHPRSLDERPALARVAPVGPAPSLTQLPDLAELAAASAELEHQPASAVVRWAWERYGRSAVLAASFQDCVLIDVAMTVAPDIEVVFLDTQYHFAETLWYVDQVRERYDFDLRVVTPTIPRDDLWQVDPDSCCEMRKVEPLARALEGHSAWLTGLRRDEAPTRANAPIVGWDVGRGIAKVNPLATWTHDDVEQYVRDRGLPEHPLRRNGYQSIGCWPCTRPVHDGEDPRAGRWAGSGKLECGLHGWTPSNGTH
jgi:phosphoadenosine phosphosulfate reductase